ncbi:MAG: T9SS type A sorting domain-containing protein [Bacteroidales bacterium]|nr:T9SS type A sorting domain-containing protein [Bacteroidales bacterium]
MRTKLLTIALMGLISGKLMAQYSFFPFDTDAKDANKKIVCTASEDGIAFVTDTARGPVIEFDGSNGYLQLGSNAFNFDAMTFNVWFLWDVPASVWWVRIFDFGKPDNPDPGNHDVNFLTTFAFEDKLRWVIHSDEAAGGIDTILMSKAKIDVKKWYMLTCVHGGGKAELYLNGELQSSKSIGFKASDLVYDNCYVGKSNWAADALFKGRMDNMAIYNKALTADEIAQLYQSQLPTVVRGTQNANVSIFSRPGRIVAQLPASLSQATIVVYNVAGLEVAKIKANSATTELPVKSGLYLVKVSSGSQNYTAKVMVR